MYSILQPSVSRHYSDILPRGVVSKSPHHHQHSSGIKRMAASIGISMAA